MIRVILGEEVRSQNKASKWRWTCEEYGVEGLSREPLLDACRKIKRMGGPMPQQEIGLYRPGKDQPDMYCLVDTGAELTVREDEKVGPVFVKWQPWNKNPTVQLNYSKADIERLLKDVEKEKKKSPARLAVEKAMQQRIVPKDSLDSQ